LSRQLDKLNNQLKTIAAWRPLFYNPNPRPMPRKPPESPELSLANFWSQGLAFETLGPWCKEAIDFINVIGNRLIAESGDSKSKKFLFERISLAIQRGNAASIRGTFPDSAILSEIFVL
jgi:hypothetical protein